MNIVIGKVILRNVLKNFDVPFNVRLPSGETWDMHSDTTLVFKTWKALLECLIDKEMGFCENYMKGNIEVEGSLEEVIKYGISSGKASLLSRLLYGIGVFFSSLKPQNMKEEAENIEYHYDIDDDFYREWLDKSMTYSCAFFENPNMSLEEAQSKKREIIYEKLRLTEGERLLDIGCGWGSLIIEASEKYGVNATGITLSENQYKFIQEEIKRRKLENRVNVYLMHYNDLSSSGMKFNKIVSVGMFEHVGKRNIRRFFKVVKDVAEEGAIFLLHTIGKQVPSSQSRWIRKRIFPGGYLPGLQEILTAMTEAGFNLIDIDDWRVHYYLTLKEWQKRFLSKKSIFEERFGKAFVRMWHLYLVSASVSFLVGSNHLFQILMSKGVNNSYPVMRRIFGENLMRS